MMILMIRFKRQLMIFKMMMK